MRNNLEVHPLKVRRGRFAKRLGFIALGLLVSSCGGSGGDEPKPPAATTVDPGSWAISAYVRSSTGALKPFRVGPALGEREAAVRKTSAALSTKSVSGNSAQLPASAPADLLLWGAAIQCGIGSPHEGLTDPSPVVGKWKSTTTATIPAWSTPSSWYIFDQAPAYCDQMLEYEESLLCVADRLSEIADASGPIEWKRVASFSPPSAALAGLGEDLPVGSWVIPPQESMSKFIVRDLAMNVISQLARLDGEVLSGHTASCGREYLAGSTPTLLYGNLSGIPGYPASGYVWGDSELVDERIGFEAHVLRAAGRLLKRLIDDSVEADLAGAELRRGAALDPGYGSQAAWGLENVPNGVYNSYGHLERVILGRQEPSPSSEPLTLLEGTYGSDLTARVNDQPIGTEGQLAAVRLVESAGLIIPNDVGVSDADLLDGIASHIKLLSATNNGISVADLGTQGQALDAVVAAMKPADLRFAARRVMRTYSLATNSTGAADPRTTGYPAATAAPSKLGSGAWAIPGGMPRSRLQISPVARLSRLAVASQRFEPSGDAAVAIKADNPYISGSLPASARAAGLGSLSAYGTGMTLRRRLAVLSAFGDTLDTSGGIVNGALAELATWTGAAQLMHAYSGPRDSTGSFIPQTLDVYVSNFDTKSLGLATEADFAGQLELVIGSPVLAECEAGLRKDCPTVPPSSVKVVTATQVKGTLADKAEAGSTTPVVKASFNIWGVPAYSVGTLITKKDPLKPGVGKVISSVQLSPPAGSGTSAVKYDIAPSFHFEEKAAQVAGWSYEAAPGLYSSTLAETPSYCVSGVDRKTFVPLENELTSDSDQYENSWKHYLTLARAAATRADELGSSLLRMGTSIELRKEAAGEQLAEICGAYSNLNSIAFTSDGKVGAGASDAALKSCVDDDVYNVLFLSKVDGPKTAAELVSFAQSVANCDSVDAKKNNWLCGKSAAEVSVGSIDLVKAPKAIAGTTAAQCQAFLDAGKTLEKTGGLVSDAVNFALGADWAADGNLASAARGTQLVVGPDAQWKVTSGGVLMMSSYATDATAKAWPACLRNVTGSVTADVACDYVGHPANLLFSQQFRRCVGGLGLSCLNPTTPSAELNEIRWRVEAALWQLGMLNGDVPAGLISTYVPVADMTGGAFAAPPSTVYAPARFLVDPSGKRRLNGWSFDDARVLGDAIPLHAGFADFSAGFLTNEADAEYKAVFGPTSASNYLMVPASNAGAVGGVNPGAPRMLFNSLRGWYCAPNARVAAGLADSAARTALRAVVMDRSPDETTDLVRGFDGSAHGWWAYTGYDGSPVLSSFGEKPTASDLPPDRRVRYFSHANYESECGSIRGLFGALVVACASQLVSPDGGNFIPEPVLLKSPSDLVRLEQRIGALAAFARSQLSKLYVTNVPKSVVDDYKKGLVPRGGTGALADSGLEMFSEMQNLGNSWVQIAGDLDLLRNAVRGARLRIDASKIREDKEMLGIAMQELRAYSDLFATVQAGISSAVATFGGTSMLTSMQVSYQLEALNKFSELRALSGKEMWGEIGIILNDLQTTSSAQWTDLEKNIGAARASAARLQEISNKRQRLVSKAVYEAARAAGADFVMIGGVRKDMPVNTALRREYNVTAVRYQTALRRAKYFAFLARRAIEQRLGLPLAAVHKALGSLPAPPAEWVDRVCSLTGLDYKKLAGEGEFAGLTEDAAVKSLSTQYIGDYVDLLEDFVTFYNLEWPSHDGDDMAVLSLKEDLLGGAKSACLQDSPNLLFHSGDLTRQVAGGGGAWRLHPCSSGKCLKTLPRKALPTMIGVPPGPIEGDGTWLVDRAPVSGDAGLAGDAGSDGSTDSATGMVDDLGKAPPGMVSQLVELTPGTYLLSWYDQARGSAGEVVTSPSEKYRAGVYDAGWVAVPDAAYVDLPSATYPLSGDAGTVDSGADTGTSDPMFVAGPWSGRRVLRFDIKTAGKYNVAFGASVTEGVFGSVLIGNVQLERASGEKPLDYSATSVSRRVITASCGAISAEALRSAFSRRCEDGTGCYYDLDVPFVVDTSTLASSRLRSKLAAGNFNFRHVTMALNLVGTGVRKCTSGSPSCYGSGFTQVSVRHDARAVSLLAADANRYEFTFGSASIERARALSAERYLTIPLSSADSSLIAQPGVEKVEFRGRPLDGSYSLRIWDDGSLDWSRLDDVQVILKYHYWSPLIRSDRP